MVLVSSQGYTRIMVASLWMITVCFTLLPTIFDPSMTAKWKNEMVVRSSKYYKVSNVNNVIYFWYFVLQCYSQYAKEAYNLCYFIFVAPCFTTSSRRGKTKFSSCGKQRHWTVFLLLEGILELRILASNCGWLQYYNGCLFSALHFHKIFQ